MLGFVAFFPGLIYLTGFGINLKSFTEYVVRFFRSRNLIKPTYNLEVFTLARAVMKILLLQRLRRAKDCNGRPDNAPLKNRYILLN